MTAAKTAAPSQYVSGHCGVAAHDRCRGEYAGCACTCTCHQEPDEPEPEPEPEVLEQQPGPAPTRHCPTCACEVDAA